MRKVGQKAEAVLKDIDQHLNCDVPWQFVLNSICTQPHPVAVAAFTRSIATNLGDVRIFKGTYELEKKAIAAMAGLLNAEDCHGSLVSGGTEANLLAIYVARKHACARRGDISRPEVIVAETVHFSMQKIFDMLGITPRTVEVDHRYKMDVSQVQRLINDNTIAIVGTAGTSEFGSVDPIEELSRIAAHHDLYFHVDAATGGFIIPFARALGYELPNFDFSLPGVCSITLDPHKYGLVNIPAGGIFFRTKELHSMISLDSFFASTPVHRTFLGTRPGGAAAASYATFETLGQDGFIETTKSNYQHMEYLVERLESLGYQVPVAPELNIVIVALADAIAVSRQLEARGWIISVSKRFSNCLRLVINQHVDREVIDRFLQVLQQVTPDQTIAKEEAAS